MKKILFIIIFCISIIQVGYSQNANNITIKAGRGYFGDFTMYNISPDINEIYNPLYFKKYQGNSIFFEVSHKMPNNYSIGFKIGKAETKRPYNDYYLTELLSNNYSLVTFDFYEILFGYDWQFGRHRFTLNAGPVFNKYADSMYDGIVINEGTDEYGTKYGTIILSEPIIIEREWWDFGMNPGISYEFFLNKSIGIGIKAEAYFLADYGFAYLSISPTICIKI
ncbi:MAG: hypothetical protein PF541_05175 [Prolixibacteraceae bacterium]|nr:hypothetical protein [Prolixibacteraceae bacterium]